MELCAYPWTLLLHVCSRAVADYTRSLDPTRPIMFADNMPYDQDLCVSGKIVETLSEIGRVTVKIDTCLSVLDISKMPTDYRF